MYYKNSLKKIKNINYKLVNFDNFSTPIKSSEDAPIMCVNFDCNNNQLKKSYGEVDFQCCRGVLSDEIIYPEIANLTGVSAIKYFKRSSLMQDVESARQLYALTQDNKLYYANLDSGTTNYSLLGQLDENSIVKLLTYFNDSTNYLIASSRNNDTYKLFIYDGYSTVPTELNVPYYVYDICKHNDHLFLLMGDNSNISKVMFGEDLNPLNISNSISEMKSLDVPVEFGKVLKLISLDDLYIICEYGIYKVMSYSKQENHYVEKVYSGNFKIIERSVVVGGDSIFFADEKGLYVFNGNSVEKINLNIDEMFDLIDVNGVACFNEGKYYYATRLSLMDEIFEDYNKENNALIVYDLFNKKVDVCSGISISDMDIYCDRYISRVAILTKYNNVSKLKTLSNSGMYNGKVAKKVWYSKNYVANSDKKKLIKCIYIDTVEDVKLRLEGDNCNSELSIKGDYSCQKIVINKQSKTFSLKLVSESENPCIKSLKVLVGEYE